MKQRRILNILLWAVPFLVFLVFAVCSISKEFFDFKGDGAQYIMLAESIAHGTGYRAFNYPGAPFYFNYPPGFPLLLAPIIFFLGRSFLAMRLVIAVFGCTTLFILYKLFKRYADKKIPLFTISFLATHLLFLLYSAQYVASEIPYLCCAALTFTALYRYLEKDDASIAYGFLVACGITMSYFIRYAGIALFPGILLTLFLGRTKKKIKKASVICIGFLVPFALWHLAAKFLFSASIERYYQYFTMPQIAHTGVINTTFKEIIVNSIRGASYYARAIGPVFFYNFFMSGTKTVSFLKDVFSFFVVVPMVYGIYIHMRRHKQCVFSYYCLMYFLLISAWPYRESDRLLLPLLPFIAFYFFLGAQRIVTACRLRIFSLLVCLLVFANMVPLFPVRNFPKEEMGSYTAHFMAIHAWINNNIDDEGVILSFKPRVTSFYSGHTSVGYPFTRNVDALWQGIIRNKIKYILVDEHSRETRYYLGPMLAARKENLELVHRIGDIGFFRVLP